MIGALAQIKPTNMRDSAPGGWLRGEIPPEKLEDFAFFFKMNWCNLMNTFSDIDFELCGSVIKF